VQFLSLAWSCKLVISNYRFNARPVVYLLYIKLLGDNIYKQWKLGGVMVVWLVIETWIIGKGNAKRGEWKVRCIG
jgi:hypothetical protein